MNFQHKFYAAFALTLVFECPGRVLAGCDVAETMSLAQSISSEASAFTEKTVRENQAKNEAHDTSELRACYQVDTKRLKRLVECANDRPDKRKPELATFFDLTVAQAYLATAVNFHWCHLGAEINAVLWESVVSRDPGNEKALAALRATKQFDKDAEEAANRYVRRMKVLVQPLAARNNGDAMRLMGVLLTQPELAGPDADANLAADYLYRAGLQFLKAGEREKAIIMIGVIEGIDQNQPLARRLREEVYGKAP